MPRKQYNTGGAKQSIKLGGNKETPQNKKAFAKLIAFGLLAFFTGRTFCYERFDANVSLFNAASNNIPTTSSSSSSSSSLFRNNALLLQCSNLTKHLIERKLVAGGDDISRRTQCPLSDAWLSGYLENYPSTSSTNTHHNQKFIFLNFGCNKGYDSLRVARDVTHNTGIFDKEKWQTALGIDDLGVCGQAFDVNPNIPPNNNKDDGSVPIIDRQVEVHCVEAMPMTYDRLAFAAQTTGVNQHGLFVHNYALTGPNNNNNGGGGGGTFIKTIPFPNTRAGQENLGMDACLKPEHKQHCTDVPAATVDEFVAKHVDHIINNNDGTATTPRRLSFVTIDVEGFDYTIMKAAQQTLTRTDYLEFEFHELGDWAQQNLKDAIDMLHGHGLYCYWTGHNKLWRITDCWMDVYGSFHMWSNIGCVNPEHQPALATKMEQIFEETILASLRA